MKHQHYLKKVARNFDHSCCYLPFLLKLSFKSDFDQKLSSDYREHAGKKGPTFVLELVGFDDAPGVLDDAAHVDADHVFSPSLRRKHAQNPRTAPHIQNHFISKNEIIKRDFIRIWWRTIFFNDTKSVHSIVFYTVVTIAWSENRILSDWREFSNWALCYHYRKMRRLKTISNFSDKPIAFSVCRKIISRIFQNGAFNAWKLGLEAIWGKRTAPQKMTQMSSCSTKSGLKTSIYNMG